MSDTIKIKEQQFWDQFKPKKNKLDKNASYEGHMFETFGKELDFVRAAFNKNPLTVWTIMDCDGNPVICQGYHFVDRIGYLITTVPALADTEYIIEGELEDVINNGDIESTASVNMTDFFDYDTPDELKEWSWIQANASFQHIHNGESGVYEFVINMSKTFEDIPPTLQQHIAEAKTKRIAYLIFHQGT